MVVSIAPHTHLFPPRLLKLPFSQRSFFPRRPFNFKPKPKHISTSNASSSNSSTSPDRIRTLFPGGFKRPEISVPTLILRVTANEVMNGSEAINGAVMRGVGIVVLEGGEEEGGGGGGRVYEAACVLKPLIADRAYFLIADRVDVASAVGASGVVLRDDGIPTIVARNMMMQSKSDSIYLPLVARVVQNLDSAKTASSSEGADFLIIDSTDISRVLHDSVDQPVKVPVFFTLNPKKSDSDLNVFTSKLLKSGASGVIISLNDLPLFTEDYLKKIFCKKYEVNEHLEGGKPIPGLLEESGNEIPGFRKLGEAEKELIERERVLLDEAVSVIRKAVPTMEEVSLLVDAISCLTEPFLLVIVGEFNSGKSTVINALLGRKYLKDGVIPTTNEITLLSYSENESVEQERCERHPDGQFVCYISSPILKEMNLVDTPGTNVILQRQQRLTEEFVPRADLILFILSADRPLTDSEVEFLLYVQQWKKKIVFVLNKMDIYRNATELEEAISFVKQNTSKLLNTETITLFPLSARSALESKLSLQSPNSLNLQTSPQWHNSKFSELEDYLLSFLDGSTENGKQRVRIKMETPVGIADRLLSSCERFVRGEFEEAVRDLESIEDLVSSVRECVERRESESEVWKKKILSSIEKAKERAINMMESTLQLSNLDLIFVYAFKGEKSSSAPASSAVQNEILTPALSEVQTLLGEFSTWLESSNTKEANYYLDLVHERWHALLEERQSSLSKPCPLARSSDDLSVKILQTFNTGSASRVFEKEIHEVALGTFGGLGAAGLSASLLTSVLSTTLEDLLALAFCSAGGFLVISNFPSRKKQAVDKIAKVADALALEVEEAMQKDLKQSSQKLSRFVESVCEPYREAAQRRIDYLESVRAELARVEESVRSLKVDIQNVNVS
ncbi:hypothetical protein LUZ60_003692 [Juncus effusus]|nr:hypothetical protein LUZ60_003692 [Juncus effusus]